jgi:hypothetical protein
MANLTPYLTEKYTKMIAEITADLGKTPLFRLMTSPTRRTSSRL